MRTLPFGMTPMQYEERYHKCHACGCELNEYYMPKKQEIKMTRNEAVKIMNADPSFSGEAWIKRFEALGLLKFEEPKKEVKHCISIDINQFKPEMNIGVAKLELWPEGLVLWVGGQIVWKSWEPTYPIQTSV